MTTIDDIEEPLPISGRDMWLGLAVSALELLADAKDARRERKKQAAVSVPAPVPAPTPALVPEQARTRSLLAAIPVAGPDAQRAGRRLNRAAGLLAASVLADSAIEHYRGSFRNKAMYTPLVVSTLSLLASAHGTADKRPAGHAVRDASYLVTGLTGLIGTAFHIYNVGKRTGGFVWQNLFYGAPLGAPAALTLSGMIGFLAERVRNNKPGTAPRILFLPAGRVVGLATAVGLMGTVGEAGLLHFRGAFQDPFMYVPVTVPPVAAVAIGRASLGPANTSRRATRWWLRVAALVGFAGSAFHIYGVSRAMGGWRNWRQNMIDGPPIPAPPAFTGLALAGLAALDLMEDKDA